MIHQRLQKHVPATFLESVHSDIQPLDPVQAPKGIAEMGTKIKIILFDNLNLRKEPRYNITFHTVCFNLSQGICTSYHLYCMILKK